MPHHNVCLKKKKNPHVENSKIAREVVWGKSSGRRQEVEEEEEDHRKAGESRIGASAAKP